MNAAQIVPRHPRYDGFCQCLAIPASFCLERGNVIDRGEFPPWLTWSKRFEQWKTVAELKLQFLERLGELKLRVAQSDLVRAVAAQHWAVARMKAATAVELEASLKRLRRRRHAASRDIERLGRHARAAAKIRSPRIFRPAN